MAWKGKFFGAVIGLLLTRNLWGAVIGAFIGDFFGERFGMLSAGSDYASVAGQAAAEAVGHSSVADIFFRTTFELMGHVAKADGWVSRAEIDAARRLMEELNMGPNEVRAAIASFRIGKSGGYDVEARVAEFATVCSVRHDLLRPFIELQMRAALAGSGMALPARTILTRVAERLGLSGLEFVQMERALRARQYAHAERRGSARPAPRARPLAPAYAELEVDPGSSDQEVTKAYRRQLSRHHPDKLVANGLPESMAQVAKEKTQRVQEAYEAIRAARGMR
jgi:DnaJ like chaperone protein